MEIKKILEVNDYEYNMIILEIGCKAAENRYPGDKATFSNQTGDTGIGYDNKSTSET
ncbi:MAG: hypothetical protein V8R91_20725 [Butyricimonas faecihominis]